MNLIICDQQCLHQKEGYCTLNHISSLTMSTDSQCGYCQTKQPQKKNIKKQGPSAENR